MEGGLQVTRVERAEAMAKNDREVMRVWVAQGRKSATWRWYELRAWRWHVAHGSKPLGDGGLS
jgi:hypothetical protein